MLLAAVVLAQQVITIGVLLGGGVVVRFREYLCVRLVVINQVTRGAAIAGLTLSDTVDVITVLGEATLLLGRHHAVPGVIGIGGDDTAFRFRQGIAVGIVCVGHPTLLRQAVVGVVVVGGGHTVNDGLGAVAHLVIGVACAVVSVGYVSNGLAGKTVQSIVAVVAGSAAQLIDLSTAARGIQGVVKLLQGDVGLIGTGQLRQAVQVIVAVSSDHAVGLSDCGVSM